MASDSVARIVHAGVEKAAAGFASDPPHKVDTLRTALLYSGVPALAMGCGSIAVCFGRPSKMAQAISQRFSSGLLMGVAIIDIFPLLHRRLYPFGEGRLDFWNTFALYLGFVTSVVLMYFLQWFGHDAEPTPMINAVSEYNANADDEDSSSDSTSGESGGMVSGATITSMGSLGSAGANPSVRFRRWNTSAALDSLDFAKEFQPARQESEVSLWAPARVPFGLILAVVIDCSVDGMLLGLTTTAAKNTGLTLAIAASLESAFLGFTFTVRVLTAMRRRWAAVIAALPCLAMVLSASMSAVFSDGIEHTPVFAGLLSFSLIALLFMILEDLLVEARETEFGEAWTIGVWFYVGLLLSITFDIAL